MATDNNSFKNPIVKIDIKTEGNIPLLEIATGENGQNDIRYAGTNLHAYDTITAIDTGTGFWYIIDYKTNNTKEINQIDPASIDQTPKQIVGKYIAKQNSVAESILEKESTDIKNASKYNNESFYISDTGIKTNLNELRTDNTFNSYTNKPYNYGRQTLNAKYTTTVGTYINAADGTLQPQINPGSNKIDDLQGYKDASIISDTVEIVTTAAGSTYKIYTDLSDINNIKDITSLRITNLKGVFGIPHQFNAITDPRLDVNNRLNDSSIGRAYGTKILKNIPLLMIVPGEVKFAPNVTQSGRNEMLHDLMINDITSFNAGNYSGKYYTLAFAYRDYFKYVNLMLRLAANYLGLQKIKYDDTTLGNINWLYANADANTEVTNPLNNAVFNSILRTFGLSNKVFGNNCICLYANCGETVQDRFGNETARSQLANTVDSYSDTVREAQFLSGGVAGWNSDAISNTVNNVKEKLDGWPMIQGIMSKAHTILSGGRLVFPDIWSNSQFGRSYDINMKLVSPSGDRLSVFLNILVPIYHILALTLPRQTSAGDQGFGSPFLIRMYYKGMFNIDVGIITDLSLTRGAEGEWTVDGIPTVAELSFSVKDMYQNLFMSKTIGELFTNIAELDYIANSCGVNVNEEEVSRAINLIKAITVPDYSSIKGIMDNMAADIGQWMNNTLNSIWATRNW